MSSDGVNVYSFKDRGLAMSKLAFNILFDGRGGNSPVGEGYTYHHILPWRYYYAAGVILAQVARMMCAGMSFNAKPEKARYDPAGMQAELKKVDSDAKLKALYGAGHINFRNDLRAANISAYELLDICRAMHGAGSNKVNEISASIGKNVGFNFEVIGDICNSPKFGGFWGVAPEHRRDDPESGPEMNRPFSVDEARWGALQLLCKHLTSFCPGLLGAKAGSTIPANVDVETFLLFKSNLDKLIAQHNYPSVFRPSDWSFWMNGVKAWQYVTEENIKAKVQSSGAGKVLSVRISETEPQGSTIDQLQNATGPIRLFSPVDTDKKLIEMITKVL